MHKRITLAVAGLLAIMMLALPALAYSSTVLTPSELNCGLNDSVMIKVVGVPDTPFYWRARGTDHNGNTYSLSTYLSNTSSDGIRYILTPFYRLKKGVTAYPNYSAVATDQVIPGHFLSYITGVCRSWVS